MSKLVLIDPTELKELIREAIREANKPGADELIKTAQVAEILGCVQRTALNRCKRVGMTNHGSDASPRWRRGDVESLIQQKAS